MDRRQNGRHMENGRKNDLNHDTPQNIVLVTADSVRADHCGFLNPEMETTPTLDRLAEESLIFEDAIAPGPRTPSSMPIIWTGEHVGNELMGVYNSRAEKQKQWRERRRRIFRHLSRFETIAERLARRGYSTGAVTTNPWTDTDTGFDQGFDHFEQIESIPKDSPSAVSRKVIKKLSQSSRVPDADRWLLTWPDIYHRVMKVRRDLSEPYFLWVFLLDTHQPYFVPRKYREENLGVEMYYANAKYNYSHTAFEDLPDRLETRLEASYRDAIRSVDSFVSRLFDDLESDDPAFVFHSDHGEAMMEHGTRGHRPELYEENLHVPLLAHNVGTTGRISEQVNLRRLPRFLLSVARNKSDFTQLVENPLIARTEERERTAIRTQKWKQIVSSEEWDFVLDGEIDELYNLSVDPGEIKNVYDEYQAVAELHDQWKRNHDRTLREREYISTAVEDLIIGNV